MLTTTPSCDTNSLLTRSSEGPSSSPTGHVGGAAIQHSVISAASTPQGSSHRVGIIVGACLGAAGAMLLIGLVLFWLILRHRHPTATAEVHDVIPRNCQWGPRDFLGGHGVVVVANHPSRSIDLAGADTDTASVAPTSDETSETKQWNKSTEVLDISMENAPRSPLPPLPLPEPIDPSIPTLCIHTNVQAELSPRARKPAPPLDLLAPPSAHSPCHRQDPRCGGTALQRWKRHTLNPAEDPCHTGKFRQMTYERTYMAISDLRPIP
ncbi:hypothetical protein BJV77DRAFT_809455 [Russula vinacea]|nr:hypothetical protein BJV77DRAFT_809455 [Russula vinacea]